MPVELEAIGTAAPEMVPIREKAFTASSVENANMANRIVDFIWPTFIEGEQ